jgi:hypothetical protein
MNQTFSFTYSDQYGYEALASMIIRITDSPEHVNNACYIAFNRVLGLVWLARDNAAYWDSAVLGSSATLQNSQCTIAVGGASVSASGNLLTLSLPLAFSAAYAGAKNIYSYVWDAESLCSALYQLGTWAVADQYAPAVVSATPSSGAGTNQTFSFTYSDQDGYADLATVVIRITDSPNNVNNSCYIAFDPPADVIGLASDNAAYWNTALLGAPGTLQNSQCSIDVAGASVSASGIYLTLSLPLSFTASYAGAKNIYSYAWDIASLCSALYQLGTWAIP